MALAARLLAPSSARRTARLLLSDSTDAVTNLAIEEWLFRSAKSEVGPLLYCYRNAPTVVIGRNQNLWKQCRMGALRASGVALVRRSSGGGAVYHDFGNSSHSIFPVTRKLKHMTVRLQKILKGPKRF